MKILEENIDSNYSDIAMMQINALDAYVLLLNLDIYLKYILLFTLHFTLHFKQRFIFQAYLKLLYYSC